MFTQETYLVKRIKALIESSKSPSEIIKEEFIDDLNNGMEQKRKKRGKRSSSRYVGVNPKTHTAYFKTSDPGGSGNEHEQHVRFPDYTDVGRLQKNITTKEKVQLALKAGEIEVYCTCPDFTYGGHKYMAHADGYGTRKEVRFPDRNNPDLEGTVCKHVNSVVRNIDSFIDDITKDFENAQDNNYRVVRRD